MPQQQMLSTSYNQQQQLPTYGQQHHVSLPRQNGEQQYPERPKAQDPSIVSMQQERQQLAARNARNPYAGSSATALLQTLLAPPPLPYESARLQSPPPAQPPVPCNPYALVAAATTVERAAACAPATTCPSVATALFSVPLATPAMITCSYLQLRDLLLRAQNDEAVYRQAYGKFYAVPMKQIGPKLHFNVVKKLTTTKEKEKKKGDKVRILSSFIVVSRCNA